MSRRYTPAEVWELSEVSPEQQREFRRRGFLSNFGIVGEGGRWSYSLRDVVAFAVATHVFRTRNLDQHTALQSSWSNAQDIISMIRSGSPDGHMRFICFLSSWSSSGGGTSLYAMPSLSALEQAGLAFQSMMALDLWSIARSIDGKLRQTIAEEAVEP